MSTFCTLDWKHAQNYVAKNYLENVERDVYFEDVKLQMEAKLWGEEYNRHNPPKKVDNLWFWSFHCYLNYGDVAFLETNDVCFK